MSVGQVADVVDGGLIPPSGNGKWVIMSWRARLTVSIARWTHQLNSAPTQRSQFGPLGAQCWVLGQVEVADHCVFDFGEFVTVEVVHRVAVDVGGVDAADLVDQEPG